ncbi:hypothetical protein EUGRSUZ_B03322 [Eucalyptus grandis]|uniref:Uncharacterized protein n=2 Tax=Eucalyptus grandis TaxID=71139 RepID=A0ACC3LW59_EUCGR|nr:hypothetical protein EUGRSUZ_B03322 [Eucalyptus grandis]
MSARLYLPRSDKNQNPPATTKIYPLPCISRGGGRPTGPLDSSTSVPCLRSNRAMITLLIRSARFSLFPSSLWVGL